MAVKYVIGHNEDPYDNLASEAELMSHVELNKTILFLWQNKNTIVVGRNQDVNSECKVDEFLQSGGKIARRQSGGGAVYHDLGNLNYSIICRKEEVEEYDYRKIIEKALSKYGIKTRYNGRNDLVWRGRKFSGNASYSDGEVVCQHGTILIDSSVDTMMRFLTPDISKLERNHVGSVSSRVVNLIEASPYITVANMRKALIDTMNAEPYEYEVIQNVKADYMELFSSAGWIYGGTK